MEQRFDARELNRRRRPRASVVLSIIGAVAATLLWVAMVVTMVWAVATLDGTYGPAAGFQAIFVVVGAPLLWAWWRELLQPDVYPEPPQELDEPPRGNRALSGEDPPPKRW